MINRTASLIAVLLSAFTVPGLAQQAANLLKDASFEDLSGDGGYSEHWTKFGNGHVDVITPRTGHFAAKIFGRFENKENWSGVYQDVPAEEGRRYTATGYFRQNTGDRLESDNGAWVKLEFLDAQGQVLQTSVSPMKIRGKGVANRYSSVNTGIATAPPGTVKARFVAIFRQGEDNAPGAVIVDDVDLREVQ